MMPACVADQAPASTCWRLAARVARWRCPPPLPAGPGAARPGMEGNGR